MEARQRRVWIAGGLGVALLIHALLAFLMFRSLEGDRRIAEARNPPDVADSVIVAPRPRPPVTLQLPEMPMPALEAILPPPISDFTTADGKDDVFCFETRNPNGFVLYSCMRLWGEEDASFNARLNDDTYFVYQGPLLGRSAFTREELERMGAVRRSGPPPKRDPTRDKVDETGADQGRDPSPIPD